MTMITGLLFTLSQKSLTPVSMSADDVMKEDQPPNPKTPKRAKEPNVKVQPSRKLCLFLAFVCMLSISFAPDIEDPLQSVVLTSVSALGEFL